MLRLILITQTSPLLIDSTINSVDYVDEQLGLSESVSDATFRRDFTVDFPKMHFILSVELAGRQIPITPEVKTN